MNINSLGQLHFLTAVVIARQNIFFSTNLPSSISDVFTKDSYSDVTLVSDDLIQFKSHKCVLSSCSPVLENLLLNNPHFHPLIFLRGIKQQELGSILLFIYLGEARFYEGNMDRFMEAVKDLQIKQFTGCLMTPGYPFLNREEHDADDNMPITTSDQDISHDENKERLVVSRHNCEECDGDGATALRVFPYSVRGRCQVGGTCS